MDDFDSWMMRVNAILEGAYGLCADDLPDCTWADWYDDQLSPRQAAALAIANAQD